MSATQSAPRRLYAVLEILTASVCIHLFYLSLFRAYPPSLSWLGGFLPGVLALFALVTIRVWTVAGKEQNPSLRERLQPGRWLSGAGRSSLILLAGFLAVFYVMEERGGRVGNDGTLLYAQVRSLVIDKDFNLENEFREFLPEKFQGLARWARSGERPIRTRQEVGPVIFWLPFFVTAHLLVKIAGALGANIAADGYSHPYINVVCLGNLLWAFVGVILSYRIARRRFRPNLAAWSAVVLWLASPLFWYTVVEPSMPHAVALATVAFFLYSWVRAAEKGGVAAWVVVAAAAGVMISTQRYNIFYLAAPALTLLVRAREALTSLDGAKLRRAGIAVALCLVVLLLVSAPQLIDNLMRHGSLIRDGDLPSAALQYWADPYVSEFLFSSNRGLFSWTPVALFSVVGLFMLLSRRDGLAAVFVVTLGAGIYLLSSTWDWYSGFSFGSRRLTEAYPIFLLGLCSFMSFATKSPRFLVGTVCALLAAWNFSLAGQVRRAEVPQMGTFAFSEASSKAVGRWYEKVGHPFAIPANWIFAWRYGVTPDRFDLVWGHRQYHELAIDVGSDEDRYFVGRGWSFPERTSAGGTFRWSEGENSSWLIGLFEPFDYRLRFTGRAARGGEGFPQRIAVWVNGERVGVVTMPEEPTTVEMVVPARFWWNRLNEIILRYGFTVRADDLYGGSDPRRIAIQLERLELSIVK